jgi:periplasmic divalent cation tolerance protein
MTEEIAIFVTTNTLELTHKIAEELVKRRLAACVNVIPGIDSIYRWEGEIQHEREFLLIIKSSRNRFDEIEAAVKELHTYEVPEVIALPIELGSQSYLEWLRGNISK